MFTLELHLQKRGRVRKVIGEEANSCSDWALFNSTTSVHKVKLDIEHRMAFKWTLSFSVHAPNEVKLFTLSSLPDSCILHQMMRQRILRAVPCKE